MDGYILSDEDASKSVGSRFRNTIGTSIASLSSSARRAATNAAETFGSNESGYRDLDGDATPASRVEAIEAAEKAGSESAYARAARLLRGSDKKAEDKKADDESEEPSPALAVSALPDAYVQMDDDGPRTKHSSLATTLSRASAAVIASFKTKPASKDKDGGARLSAKPYIAEFAEPMARHEAPTSTPALVAAHMSAAATLDGVSAHSGGLWSLKAKLVVLEKEREEAQAACDEAQRRARDRHETLEEATSRCSRLQRRELFLRELLRHASEIEGTSSDNRREKRRHSHPQVRAAYTAEPTMSLKRGTPP